MSGEMTCRELVGFLADYLEQTLDDERVEAFEKHLAGCRSCTAYLASYRDTIRMARGTVVDPGLAELPEELVKAIIGAMNNER